MRALKICVALAVLAGLRLADFDGGNLRNEIPREAKAHVVVKNEKRFAKLLKSVAQEIAAEFRTPEPNLKITATEASRPARVMRRSDQVTLILRSGISMSARTASSGGRPAVAGLVSVRHYMRRRRR